MIVIDAGSASSKVREVALAVTNGDWSTDVESVWILHSTHQFVDADGLNLGNVLFTVSFCWFDDNFSFLSFLCLSEGFIEAWNELTATDDANHWFVGSALLVSIMFLGDCFTGGLDEVTCFVVVEFIIDVYNCSIIHSNTSLSGSPATVAPLIIPLESPWLTLRHQIRLNIGAGSWFC